MFGMLIAAVGTFILGATLGVVGVVSWGVRREEKRFRNTRRFQEERALWGVPRDTEQYIEDEAPDGVTSAARRINGLYVLRRPSVGQEASRRWPTREGYDAGWRTRV
jgi:hypothetical protein